MSRYDPHPQAEVPGCDFSADAKIVNLLAYFNRFGCRTLYSCQGTDLSTVYSERRANIEELESAGHTSDIQPNDPLSVDDLQAAAGYVMFAGVSTVALCIELFEQLIRDTGNRLMLSCMTQRFGNVVGDVFVPDPEADVIEWGKWWFEMHFRPQGFDEASFAATSLLDRPLTDPEAVKLRLEEGWCHTVRLPAAQIAELDAAAREFLLKSATPHKV